MLENTKIMSAFFKKYIITLSGTPKHQDLFLKLSQISLLSI